MKKLSPQQSLFVDHYFRLNFNGTKAAIEAGYSERSAAVTASRLLRYANVRAEIERRLSALTMSADEVLIRLTEQARGSMTDFVRVLPGGIAMLDLEKAQAASQLHLIKKFKVTKNGIEIELYDAQSALTWIGKHHALFTEKVQVEDDHWRAQAVADIRAGLIPFEALAEAFDHDLATQLFTEAGVPVQTG